MQILPLEPEVDDPPWWDERRVGALTAEEIQLLFRLSPEEAGEKVMAVEADPSRPGRVIFRLQRSTEEMALFFERVIVGATEAEVETLVVLGRSWYTSLKSLAETAQALAEEE